MTERSLQETYAPRMTCFGCGPANAEGLHIRSFVRGEEVVCDWQPAAKYEAYPGMLSGGIIGTLLDCHSNWTAAYHLLRPTPTDQPVHLSAHVVEAQDDRAIVEAQLIAHDKVCATCRGTFVAVKPGHPAYHRW